MRSLVGLLPLKSSLAEPVDDSGFVDVVRGHLKLHAVAGGKANEAFAHFARDMGENGVIVRELDAEHGASQDGSDLPFQFDSFFRIHIFAKPALTLMSAGSHNQKRLISSANPQIDADALHEAALR